MDVNYLCSCKCFNYHYFQRFSTTLTIVNTNKLFSLLTGLAQTSYQLMCTQRTILQHFDMCMKMSKRIGRRWVRPGDIHIAHSVWSFTTSISIDRFTIKNHSMLMRHINFYGIFSDIFNQCKSFESRHSNDAFHQLQKIIELHGVCVFMWVENVINRDFHLTHHHNETMEIYLFGTQESHTHTHLYYVIGFHLHFSTGSTRCTLLTCVYSLCHILCFSIFGTIRQKNRMIYNYLKSFDFLLSVVMLPTPSSRKTLPYTKCFTLLFSTSSLPHLFIHITFHFVYTLVFHILAE